MNQESLLEEYKRLKKEVEEKDQELNEQQKELSPDNAPSTDFYANRALAEHKLQRLKEIEAQLQANKETLK